MHLLNLLRQVVSLEQRIPVVVVGAVRRAPEGFLDQALQVRTMGGENQAAGVTPKMIQSLKLLLAGKRIQYLQTVIHGLNPDIKIQSLLTNLVGRQQKRRKVHQKVDLIGVQYPHQQRGGVLEVVEVLLVVGGINQKQLQVGALLNSDFSLKRSSVVYIHGAQSFEVLDHCFMLKIWLSMVFMGRFGMHKTFSCFPCNSS